MKTTVSEIQNILVGKNSTLDTAEEKISGLEYSNRNYQQQQKKTIKRLGENSISELQDNIKQLHICVIRVSIEGAWMAQL